ncbi:MAG: hypothetical protein CM15mP127_15570 [Gammaproteobacteria bacterium]|nr:MAG: hypothetical protein CM15mP127_15570 [Gammaproteobacteria bacterium]
MKLTLAKLVINIIWEELILIVVIFIENYAHCDTPGDLNLSTFSIERDKKWSSHSSKML